jgi:DNA-binding response OmpR family regulator
MNNAAESKRVLVVDDDRDFVKTLELYLKYAGYEVSCAYGGIGALEELRITNPSAIILDVLMPDIDGRSIVRFIREKMGDKDTAVIVLTALSDSNARMDLMIDGANAFLTKPCDPERISRTVERFTSHEVKEARRQAEGSTILDSSM